MAEALGAQQALSSSTHMFEPFSHILTFLSVFNYFKEEATQYFQSHHLTSAFVYVRNYNYVVKVHSGV